jgi:hypothetical protein
VAAREVPAAARPDTALSVPADSSVADTVVADTAGVAARIDAGPTPSTRTAAVSAGDVGGALLPVAAVPRTRDDPALPPGAAVSPRRDRPTQGMPRRSSVTVRSLAAVTKGWTPLRASADRDAPIVGTVGPETRVQLGESRGEWVRLSSGALSGWAERRQFVVR